MKRVLEKEDMGTEEIMRAYVSLKTLDLVNNYFLEKAMEICPGGKVLDVGCGTGKMLQNMPSRFERHGVDINEKMISQA